MKNFLKKIFKNMEKDFEADFEATFEKMENKKWDEYLTNTVKESQKFGKSADEYKQKYIK